MPPPLNPSAPSSNYDDLRWHDRLVFCVAAPAEARAVAAGLGMDVSLMASEPHGSWTPITRTINEHGRARELVLLQTGVGKVNAAAAVTAYLTQLACESPSATRQHIMVLSVGVCGLLPNEASTLEPPSIGDAVLATVSLYGDEGIATPDGFTDMSAAGFSYGTPTTSPVMGVPILPRVRDAITAVFTDEPRLHLGPIATISTCAGTDALAHAVAHRTGALVEAMEGAAIGHAVHRLSTRYPTPHNLSFCELRTISNTTGDRGRQQWNLSLALAHLSRAVRLVARSVERGELGRHLA